MRRRLYEDLLREGDARADRLGLLKTLGASDVVTVTRIDRLARSTFDLFALVKRIVDAQAHSDRSPSHRR